MTEEEKKAIEEIKKALRLAKNIDDITTPIRNEYAEIIVGLIDKQQKEIEEWKEIYNNLSKTYDFILENDFIEKDKIREKIEELEDVLDLTESEKRFPKYRKQALIEEIRDLQELLEE